MSIRFRRALSSFFLIALVILSWAAQSAGQVPPSSVLSPKDRAEVFDRVWRLINEKYYDPGLN
ncbi:MAG TPA: hypothetical protein VGF08_00655, partial [Terriglobales bacterium]